MDKKIVVAKILIWLGGHKILVAVAVAIIIYKIRAWLIYPIGHFARWHALRVAGFARENKRVFAIKGWSRLYIFIYRKTLTRNELTENLPELSDIYRQAFVAVKEIRWPHYLMQQEWFVVRGVPQEWKTVQSMLSTKWRLYLGVDGLGDAVFFEPPKRGHLLFAGASGSGKTVIARNIVDVFEENRFTKIIVSTKAKDFGRYSNFFLYEKAPSDDLVKALDALDLEVEKRRDAMLELNVFDIEDTKFDPILIAIDEAAWTLRTIKKSKENEQEALKQAHLQERISYHLRQNRDVGVLVILISQRPILEELEGIQGFRSSVTIVCGRLESSIQSQAVLGSDIAFTNPLVQQGRGVMIIKTENGDLSLLKAPFKGHERK
jgi:hypothetical protein